MFNQYDCYLSDDMKAAKKSLQKQYELELKRISDQTQDARSRIEREFSIRFMEIDQIGLAAALDAYKSAPIK